METAFFVSRDPAARGHSCPQRDSGEVTEGSLSSEPSREQGTAGAEPPTAEDRRGSIPKN
jgi:hypothetical protein